MSLQTVLVELIDVCNLNCAYCLRDEAALHGKAHALPIADLTRILTEVSQSSKCGTVVFTGGEPTLHPDFRSALRVVSDIGWRSVLVTNGWSFSRVLPHLLEFKSSIEAIAFSLDGATAAAHDAHRGKRSFRRLMSAVLACRRHDLVFRFKLTVDRKKAAQISEFTAFAARLGADSLEVSPLLPANDQSFADMLTLPEQQRFLKEISALQATYRMPLRLAAGFYGPRSEPICEPLQRRSVSIDYNGHLNLCIVLSGFRGQRAARDRIADLKTTSIANAVPHMNALIDERNNNRARALETLGAAAAPLKLGSPCLDCLCSFEKIASSRLDLEKESAPMDDQLSFKVPDSVIASDFDGKEGVLLNTSTQQYVTLNETANFLWIEIEKGLSVGQLRAALCSTFDVSEDVARSSVRAVVERLESHQLITRVSAPNPDASVPETSR